MSSTISQVGAHTVEVLLGYVLVRLVGVHRIARPVIHRRYAEERELRDVRPSELRMGLAPDGLEERGCGRV